jgi:hypothetical protein
MKANFRLDNLNHIHQLKSIQKIWGNTICRVKEIRVKYLHQDEWADSIGLGNGNFIGKEEERVQANLLRNRSYFFSLISI